MRKTEAKEDGHESRSDLAALWQEALAEYYRIVKLDPVKMPRYYSMTDIMKDDTVQKSFESVSRSRALWITYI